MKNFNEWNILKIKINNKKEIAPIYHKSEIWWCVLGVNLGHEEDGKNQNFERPILVLRKFSKDLFVGIPLSTKIKEGEFYVNFKTDKLEYSVLLSQARVLSADRLVRKINKISRGGFSKVIDGYRKLMEL